MPNIFGNTKCMMFAEYTVLDQSHNGQEELYNDVQNSLDSMYKWCLDNQITLNIKIYVHFTYRKQINPNHEFKLGEIVLNAFFSWLLEPSAFFQLKYISGTISNTRYFLFSFSGDVTRGSSLSPDFQTLMLCTVGRSYYTYNNCFNLLVIEWLINFLFR